MSSNDIVSADIGDEKCENHEALTGRKRGRSEDDEKEIYEPCPALPPPALHHRPEQDLSSNDVDVSGAALPTEVFSKQPPVPGSKRELERMPSSDKRKFETAYNRQKEDDRTVLAAHTHLVESKSKFHRAKSSLEKAQASYDETLALSKKHSGEGADDLLLAPTEWNSRYFQLKSYFEKEGHSRIKKNVLDADVRGMSKEEASEFRALSRWVSRQRKLKRNQDLDHHKELLLDRLEFNWEPKRGCGSDIKWLQNYELLKEFKRMHNHVDVPTQYGEEKLGLWMKNQLNLYRNGKEGKVPAINADRIRMLEELGITWGKRRKGIPWEERFHALLDYKERYGHSNVPWQWKENVPLAQWVNTQRKKYKDQEAGKKNNLADSQIDLMNSIGFKWSTGGKGRYMNTIASTPDEDQQSSNVNEEPSSIAASSVAVPLMPQVAGLAVANNESSPAPATLSAVKSSEGVEAVPFNPSLMVTNLQLSFTGTSQNQHNMVAHNAMAPNLAHYVGGNPHNPILGANQPHSGFGATSLQNALQIPDTSTSTQAMQQLLAQLTQSNPPSNTNNQINNGIDAQQRSTAQMLQELMNHKNQQLEQSTTQTLSVSHSGGMNNVLQLMQMPQNDPSTTTITPSTNIGFQQLLNQQMNQQQQQQQPQPLGNVAIGSHQMPSQVNTDFTTLLQAYEQLHNNVAAAAKKRPGP